MVVGGSSSGRRSFLVAVVKRQRSWLLLAVAAVLTVTLPSCDTTSGASPWPCDRDERMIVIFDPDNTPSGRTPDAAVDAWVPYGAERLGIEASDLRAFIAESEESGLYDGESGKIYDGDEVVAEVTVTHYDGDWFVISAWTCGGTA
jgi:hypothetical protein